jgi:sterol 3beta-glucosyltransferase
MKITILTLGTRGDVQPYIALGAGLQGAGHNVTIATTARFGSMIMEHGLQHAPLTADFMTMMEGADGRAAISGRNMLKLLKQVKPMLRQMLDESWQAAQGSDAIIYHPKAISGPHLAEKLQIPGFLAHPVPLFAATREFPSPVLPFRDLGPLLNRWSYAINRAINGPFGGLIRTWRRDVLDLSRASNPWVRNGKPVPQLYGFSPLVLPVPGDWDASVTATGFWFLDHARTWKPDPDLVQFLADGPAPVYVGFGSMANNDAARTSQIVLEAIRRSGVRAVLATGVGGLVVDRAPENVVLLREAPHDWLFPQMAAIVHHGGAGTTAAAFRAGRPQLVCPFFGDQPFWGRRVAALGVGPDPIRQKPLSVDRLTDALTTLTTDQTMGDRAAELGVKIRAEDGVGQAVAQIEAYLARGSFVPIPDLRGEQTVLAYSEGQNY